MNTEALLEIDQEPFCYWAYPGLRKKNDARTSYSKVGKTNYLDQLSGIICDVYGISFAELCKMSNESKYTIPRAHFYFFARKILNLTHLKTNLEIVRYINPQAKNESVMYHGMRTISDMGAIIDRDKQFKERHELILLKIRFQMSARLLRKVDLESFEYTKKTKRIRRVGNAKKVIATDKNGVDTAFPSVRKASRVLKIHHTNIHSVINGEYKQVKGYTFKYVEEN